MEEEEFIKKTRKIGNSAGVLLPKRLRDSKVKVTVLEKSIDIKKESLKLLDEYLEDLKGVYITNKNPYQVLAISKNTKKIINSNKIKVSIVPIKKIEKDLDLPKLRGKILNAKTIINGSLLKKLKRKIEKEK